MNALAWARAQWDRVTGAVLFALGGLALVIGWVGVSKQALTALQLPYVVSGGIGGIFLLGLGAVFWLSADMRDEWRKLDEIATVLKREVVVPTTADAWQDLGEAPSAEVPSRRPRSNRSGRLAVSVEGLDR